MGKGEGNWGISRYGARILVTLTGFVEVGRTARRGRNIAAQGKSIKPTKIGSGGDKKAVKSVFDQRLTQSRKN